MNPVQDVMYSHMSPTTPQYILQLSHMAPTTLQYILQLSQAFAILGCAGMPVLGSGLTWAGILSDLSDLDLLVQRH